MKTAYAACITRVGLSLAEAAKLHGVDISTIKQWSSGRRNPPPGVWDELRELEAVIIDRSEEIRAVWEGTGEQLLVHARWDDAAGAMAFADFILTSPTSVLPKVADR